jgi:type II secretory pathway component GspD/PulD (secretin)
MLTVPVQLRAQEAAPAAPQEAPAAVAAPQQEPAAPAPAPAVAPAPQLPPVLAPAQPPLHILETSVTATEPIVSMTFDETPLTDVIKAFRDATGANIISSGTNLQSIAVSIRLDNVPWRKGLASILDPQGFQLVEQPAGSGIYVVTTKTIEIPKVTRTFDLQYARASDITNLLNKTFGPTCTIAAFAPANVVVFTATEQQQSECEKILKVVDKPRTQVYIEARFVEMSASAMKKIGLKWDSLEEWGVEVSQIQGGFERNSGKLNHFKTGGTTVRDSATPYAGTTTPDPVTGTMTPVYMKESVNTVLSPAIIPSAPTAGRSADSMAWKEARGIGGQISADGFRMAMSAFEQVDGISVFSNPKIIVANEETALVDMTTKEPNVSVKSSRSGTSGDQLDVTAELAKIPGEREPFVGEAFYSYGISLKVVPRVSPTGQITVEIEPSISEKTGSYTIAGVSADTPVASYPIIDMRRIQTVFTMQSGTTAVIGGLTRTSEDSVDNGIPGLRKLPWIGQRLFGWKSREKTQREIVIFVTVGIADPVQLPQDIGMPKNAILSRDIISGVAKEPGDRTKEEVLSLEDPKRTSAKEVPAAPAPAAEAPAPTPTAVVTEREATEKPATAEQPSAAPLLKDN